MAEPEHPPSSTEFIEQLDKLQNMLHLSINQIADLYYVSSKTIFDWYEKINQPSSAVIQRTEILLNALNSVPPDANLLRLKSVWKIPISNKSFYSIWTTVDIECLYDQLVNKLREMNFMLVTVPPVIKKVNPVYFGDSILAEYDRYASTNY